MGSFQKARQTDPWTAFWDNYIIGGITMLSSFCLSVIHTIHYLIHNREDRMNKNYQKDKVTYTSSPLYRSHKCFMHSGPLLYTWATGPLINNKYTHIILVQISDNKYLQVLLEWDKVKITSDKPSYSQFNPVWIFPPFLDEEIRQQMHHCGKFLDFVWFHFLNAWK